MNDSRISTGKRLAVFIGATACSSLLVGCKVDQAREVQTYRQVLDAPIVASTQPTSRPAVMDDPAAPLSLSEAMRLANGGNETLESRGETYLQSLIARNRAAGSFLPTLSLGGSYGLSESNGATAESYSGSARGSMNVFNGFGDVARLNAADLTTMQQKSLLLDQQATLMLNVVQTYYQVLKLERQIDVLQRTIKLQEERVRDTEAKLKLGISRPLDLAQSKADLASTRASLTQARTNALTSRADLAFLVAVPGVRGPLGDDLAVPDEVPSVEQAMVEARVNRQDLSAAENALAAARQNVSAAMAQYYPSVSLDLSSILFRNSSGGSWWTSGLSGSLPVFSAGQIEADVRNAWSNYRQAELAQSLLSRQVLQEVEQAHARLLGSRQRLLDLAQQVAAARDALELSERSYQLGNATNLDRLSAQDTLLNAELNQVSEELDYKTYYLALQRRMGRQLLH